jgi:hypothetical protein
MSNEWKKNRGEKTVLGFKPITYYSSLITILSTTMFIALCPLTVQAAFEWQPRLLLREEFTDNLFLDAYDEESDFITTIAPGILLQYDARLVELKLDYSLHFLDYLHHDEKDETSLKDTQRISFRGVLLPGQDFSLTVLDEYQRVTIDDRRQLVEDNPFVNKSNRNLLVVNPEYRCRHFDTFVPTVGYQYERADYDKPEGDDYHRHEFYADLEKQFNPRLTATIGYRHSLYQARDEEDYKRQDATARLAYQLSPSLALRAGVGSAWINYRERSDEQAMTWNLALDWQPKTRWEGGLSYLEDFTDSVDGGLTKTRQAEAFIRHLDLLPWELLVFAEKQDYQTEDREDRSVGLNGTLGFPFTNRLILDLTGEVSLWRFLPEKEDVVRYGAGLALNYQMKYGTITVGYRYRESNSDVDENDYQNNLGYVQVVLRF